jgi:glycosyltransferase involved in cell wall biosynthesis
MPGADRGVMFLCSLLDAGGAERHWAGLIPALADRGMTVSLTAVGRGGRALEEVRARGVPVRELGFGGMGSIRAVPRLLRDPDRRWEAIVTWAPNAHAVGALTAFGARTPHVINWHRQPGLPMTPRQSAAVKLAGRMGCGVIAVTRAQVPQLVELGVREERIRVVPNGVPDPPRADRAAARAELELPAGDYVVVVVARLRPEKRHEDLIHALADLSRRMPNVSGVVVGDGETAAELRRLAAQTGAPVRFTGFDPRPERYMAAADVVCLPSEHEALPISLIEAAAASRPVVATDVAGVAEVVDEGVTGLLVRPREVAALTHALESLGADPARRERMGAAAHERWRERFSFDAMVDAYHELLQGVRGRPARWP